VHQHSQFPILGGRLLKIVAGSGETLGWLVSNPWREAIEDVMEKLEIDSYNVSNPWREAIEDRFKSRRNRSI